MATAMMRIQTKKLLNTQQAILEHFALYIKTKQTMWKLFIVKTAHSTCLKVADVGECVSLWVQMIIAVRVKGR
jgi:hypothetical protein